MGGLVKSLRIILKDVPDEVIKGVLKSFLTVLLRVFLVVPLVVSLAVLLAASLMTSFTQFFFFFGMTSIAMSFIGRNYSQLHLLPTQVHRVGDNKGFQKISWTKFPGIS